MKSLNMRRKKIGFCPFFRRQVIGTYELFCYLVFSHDLFVKAVGVLHFTLNIL